jgi:hypothetical protein
MGEIHGIAARAYYQPEMARITLLGQGSTLLPWHISRHIQFRSTLYSRIISDKN